MNDLVLRQLLSTLQKLSKAMYRAEKVCDLVHVFFGSACWRAFFIALGLIIHVRLLILDGSFPGVLRNRDYTQLVRAPPSMHCLSF